MIYVVDTHPLVWHIEANPRLSQIARGILSAPDSDLVIPSIVVAEVWYLYHRKRISTTPADVRPRIVSARNCSVYPLDETILGLLPVGFDIHDAIIVATAKLYRDILGKPVRLISSDKAIIQSGMIETIW